MIDLTRTTATGPESLIPHISIVTAPATGETVILCSRCGATAREPWPGSMAVIDAWIGRHADCLAADVSDETMSPQIHDLMCECAECHAQAAEWGARPATCQGCGAIVTKADLIARDESDGSEIQCCPTCAAL
jgi:uncharacterized C2H2 Zn-finger protein